MNRRSFAVRTGAFVVAALWLGASAASAEGLQSIAVGPIGVTVADMDRSVAFFHDVLEFEKVADSEFYDRSFDRLTGVFGARVRIADLRLGEEVLRLTQYLTPRGRPIPVDSRSNDLSFQHVAIVVRDMEEAYARLRTHKVRPVSTAPQILPEWNKDAAGIRAFYFRDPDDHNLELIWFPPGKGDPRWHRDVTVSTLFLGIDHTAITVADTEASLRFYRDTLGLRVVFQGENYGPEQEHLNHVFGARVRITSLRAPKGPGIEFLQYLIPRDGRPFPMGTQPNDSVHWQTTIFVPSAVPVDSIDIAKLPLGGRRAALVRDPDGHAVQVTEP